MIFNKKDQVHSRSQRRPETIFQISYEKMEHYRIEILILRSTSKVVATKPEATLLNQGKNFNSKALKFGCTYKKYALDNRHEIMLKNLKGVLLELEFDDIFFLELVIFYFRTIERHRYERQPRPGKPSFKPFEFIDLKFLLVL